MTALIIDLQKKLLDKNNSTTDLLRLMRLISSKLEFPDIESWILKELNGYDTKEEVPKYRQVQGTIKIKTSYHGWQPLFFENHELGESLSTRGCGQPISELESLIQSSKGDGILIMHYPLDIEQKIMQGISGMRSPMQPALFISSAQIQKIIQTVRNNILDWSLKLEKVGILGENMKFSFEEKKQSSNADISLPSKYYGHNITVVQRMTSSQIQQGNTDSVQTFTCSLPDLQKVNELINELREKFELLQLNTHQQTEVEADLATLEAQKNSPKPHFHIIKATLQSLRSILEGVASSVASAYILEKINSLLQ
jgi:hypothetical protein